MMAALVSFGWFEVTLVPPRCTRVDGSTHARAWSLTALMESFFHWLVQGWGWDMELGGARDGTGTWRDLPMALGFTAVIALANVLLSFPSILPLSPLT